jgi:hypothetical protein
MGTEHKGNLAAVLDQVCKTRHVLLATVDGELCTCLDKGLTRAKTTYVFESWTTSEGPLFALSEVAMTTELYCLLRDLHTRHGAREFGKIVQKLLAIAFRLAGFARVIERGVQGVDVDAVGDPLERSATEVKTTQEDSGAHAPDGLRDKPGRGCLRIRRPLVPHSPVRPGPRSALWPVSSRSPTPS